VQKFLSDNCYGEVWDPEATPFDQCEKDKESEAVSKENKTDEATCASFTHGDIRFIRGDMTGEMCD